MTSESEKQHPILKWLRQQFAAGLLHFQVIATPVPASRPRVARNGGVYYSKTYTGYYAECQKQLAVQAAGLSAAEGPLLVMVESVVEKPKNTILERPRGDVDNLAKGPLDAATGAGIWGDDGQVELLVTSKRWAEPGEAAHVNLYVGNMQ